MTKTSRHNSSSNGEEDNLHNSIPAAAEKKTKVHNPIPAATEKKKCRLGNGSLCCKCGNENTRRKKNSRRMAG